MAQDVLYKQDPDSLANNGVQKGWGIWANAKKHPIGIANWEAYVADPQRRKALTNLLRYTKPEHAMKDWEDYVGLLHEFAVEGVANIADPMPQVMLPSTAVVLWCDTHKSLDKMKKVLDNWKKLRDYGLHLQWVSLITENDNMFKTPSRTSHRQVFGAGLMPIFTRVSQVLPNIKKAITDTDDLTLEDVELIADELEFQLNNFCDINNYNWRILRREDALELWQALTQ